MRGFKDEQERKKQCCGTCEYHRLDNDIGWVCTNRGSIYWAEETDYTNYCTEWEERK